MPYAIADGVVFFGEEADDKLKKLIIEPGVLFKANDKSGRVIHIWGGPDHMSGLRIEITEPAA